MPNQENINALILGNYKLCRHIADGGTSSVYEIHDSDDQPYALKIITHDKFENDVWHEISVLQKLNKIIAYQLYKENLLPYIVMPFYAGSCLNWHLAEFRQYSLMHRLNFMQAMIEHIQFLHAQNIIHGDVGLNNFIYNSSTDTMYIIDFSWSRIVPGIFSDGVECYYWGWRWFNPPEHDNCKGATGGSLILKPSADIFQLGHSMLYILGKADLNPFQAQPNICDCQSLEILIAEMVQTDPELRPGIARVKSLFDSITEQVTNKHSDKILKRSLVN